MSRGFRIATGAACPIVDAGPDGPSGWHGYLCISPYNAVVEQHEGTGQGATPADALKAAVDDLARQGALDDEGA